MHIYLIQRANLELQPQVFVVSDKVYSMAFQV